jgi:hypothetical protein
MANAETGVNGMNGMNGMHSVEGFGPGDREDREALHQSLGQSNTA